MRQVDTTFGAWERRVRGRGVLVIPLTRSRRPRLAWTRGYPPLFLLPVWLTGPMREWAVCFLWCSLCVTMRGEAAVAASMADLVALAEIATVTGD